MGEQNCGDEVAAPECSTFRSADEECDIVIAFK